MENSDREERYLEKLEELEEVLSEIQRWHVGTEDLLKDKMVRKAVYKSFQESMEIVVDICAMKLSDAGKTVGDDSENIEKAEGIVFSEKITQGLLEANGLRNRIVHDYNGFDDRIALDSIQNRIEDIENFKQEVKKWAENS